MPYKDKKKASEAKKLWRTNNPEKVKFWNNLKRAKVYRPGEITWRLKQKAEVLAHYGKLGECRCSWHKCDETDIDVLTLDHINNDGAKQRKEVRRTGNRLYGWLKKNGYPDGYQTLCMNHQFKKEIVRKRGW